MNCPVDGTELRLTERQGIEIDYCPQCRGIWLDRGELDKVLERSARTAPVDDRERDRERERDRYRESERPYRERDDRGYDRDSERDYGKKSRRRSFLEDLLDFD